MLTHPQNSNKISPANTCFISRPSRPFFNVWKNFTLFFQGLEGFTEKVPLVGKFDLFPAE